MKAADDWEPSFLFISGSERERVIYYITSEKGGWGDVPPSFSAT